MSFEAKRQAALARQSASREADRAIVRPERARRQKLSRTSRILPLGPIGHGQSGLGRARSRLDACQKFNGVGSGVSSKAGGIILARISSGF